METEEDNVAFYLVPIEDEEFRKLANIPGNEEIFLVDIEKETTEHLIFVKNEVPDECDSDEMQIVCEETVAQAVDDVAQAVDNDKTNSDNMSKCKSLPQQREHEKRKRKYPCCFKECPGDQKVHTFPAVVINGTIHQQNLERCKQWVKKSGNAELLKIPLSGFHKKYYACTKHFSNNQYFNNLRSRIRSDAIPDQNINELTDEELQNFPDLHPNLTGVAETGNDTRGGKNMEQDRFDEILSQDKIKDKYQKDFYADMKNLSWYGCGKCKERFLAKRMPRGSCLHYPNCKNYSSENNMDPGEVPVELQNLSYIEQQLIARVCPVISVYKIKNHQYGYSGNVINFPQSVHQFAKQLPHKISDLKSIITVRTHSESGSSQDFHVRAKVVKDALIYLKGKNPYYRDIEISEENLNLLPEDGDVFETLPSIVVPEGEEKDNIDEANGKEDTCEKSSHLEELCVPITVNSNQDEQVKDVIDWPAIGNTPLSEFKEEGYICQAFPCLFPEGKADLLQARAKKISPRDYFKHLMRYQDKRFQKDPRFRFFALNSLMRWDSITKGDLYVKRHKEFNDMTVEQLKEKIKENPGMLDKLMYQCSSIRGTKPFWKARSRELLEMIEQIGMPTCFFTLSAADLHWPKLFELLAPDKDISTLTESERRDLIAKNPLIVDKFFLERVNSFINKVIKPKYKVSDYWYRIEYQHRGSPHVHGIIWLEGAPNVTDLEKQSPEKIKEVLNYFNNLISTVHPNVNAPPAAVHPCRVELTEVIELKKDLAELLNRVQRHTKCTSGYCLRKSKSSNKEECRFKFPKSMCEKSEVRFSDNGDVEFISERNDDRLNNYNPYWILLWRANMDIAPVLSKRALVNYLAKYVSKAETKSHTLEEVLDKACTNAKKGVKTVLHKLYIKACSERDFSAQEVAHLIMSEKMVCTLDRAFVYVHLRGDEDWMVVQNDDKANRYGTSIVEKYIQRPAQYEECSLWQMAKEYNFSTNKKRNKKAIVIACPKITYKKNSVCNEKYYRMQVLLHVPWRDMDEFHSQKKTWEAIYKANINLIEKHTPSSSLSEIEADIEENEDVNDESVPYIQSVSDWMSISAMGPDQKTQHVNLGSRLIDSLYDWNACKLKYTQYGTIQDLQNFIANEKQEYETPTDIEPYPNVDFNEQQMKIINLVEKQINLIANPANDNDGKIPRSIVVQGSAGTGKSLVIKAIKHKVLSSLGAGTMLLLTPTGVAAINIGGSTLHSKLQIFSIIGFTDLQNEAARKFCNDMKKVKFIIIDEFSMIGCGTLGMIDQRLRQATGNDEADFGGLFIYFFGDINQLPPVKDTPLYAENIPDLPLKKRGKRVWQNIESAIFLFKVHRQADTTFKKVLENISKGQVTEEDYDILKQRFETNVTGQEKKKFIKAINLFPTKDKVHEENMSYLSSLKFTTDNNPVPVAEIKAEHNCAQAEQGTTDQAGGLSRTLYLGPTCQIMLRANIWTERGLVNGAVGNIVDILYEDNKKPPENMPAVLVCQFDTYKGPYLGNDTNLKLVPIPAMLRSWTLQDGTQCTRKTFPVHLAHAITIYKSQGITLLLVKVNIGNKESPGLAFVALSRATALDGVLLEPFPKARLLKINKSSVLHLKRQFLQDLTKKELML